MVDPADNDSSPMSDARSADAELRRRTSRAARKRKLLSAGDMIHNDIMDPFTCVTDRAAAVRAYVLFEQQLAILLGESKPPTISVSKSLDSKGLRKIRQAIDVESIARLMEAESKVIPAEEAIG